MGRALSFSPSRRCSSEHSPVILPQPHRPNWPFFFVFVESSFDFCPFVCLESEILSLFYFIDGLSRFNGFLPCFSRSPPLVLLFTFLPLFFLMFCSLRGQVSSANGLLPTIIAQPLFLLLLQLLFFLSLPFFSECRCPLDVARLLCYCTTAPVASDYH